MSGYGPAWGGGDNPHFVTGNSDFGGTAYNTSGAINLSECVVAWSTTLNRVVSNFSPTDQGADVATRDQEDANFGSGGVMLLPKQSGSAPARSAVRRGA